MFAIAPLRSALLIVLLPAAVACQSKGAMATTEDATLAVQETSPTTDAL